MVDLFLSFKSSGKLLHLYLVFKKKPNHGQRAKSEEGLLPWSRSYEGYHCCLCGSHGSGWAYGVQVPRRSYCREGVIPNHQPLSSACSMEWKIEWAEERKEETLGKSMSGFWLDRASKYRHQTCSGLWVGHMLRFDSLHRSVWELEQYRKTTRKAIKTTSKQMISCTDFHQIEWPYICGYGMKSIREQETQYQLLVYGRCWEQRQGIFSP